MAWENVDEKRIKRILKQIAGRITPDDDELVPPVVIKGTGEIWCYAPIKRTVIKINRGTRAYVVDETLDEYDRLLIYTSNGYFVAIEKDEIEEIGFN
jgi:hypothetical protein